MFRVGLYEFLVAAPNKATLSYPTTDTAGVVNEVVEIEAAAEGDGTDGYETDGIVGDGNNLLATGLTFIGISKLACCSFAGSGSGSGRK
jgi:hypothetical protein